MKLPTKVDAPQVPGMRNLPFVAGEPIPLKYPIIELPGEDVTVEARLVSIQLLVRPGIGAAPILDKTITTTLTADGQITADAATTGVGAAWLAITGAESTTWTTRKVIGVTVSDSLGRTRSVDQGYLVPITGMESDYAPVDRVIVEPERVVLSLGSTQQFSGLAVDDQGLALTNRTNTYDTTDHAVATVDGMGFVTSAGVGQTELIVVADGVEGRATLTVVAAVFDSFNRDDAPTTLATADSGQLWEPLTGIWGTIDGTGYCADADGAVQLAAVIDAMVANVTVQVTVTAIPDNALIRFRVTDIDNGLFVYILPAGIYLYRVEAASSTLIDGPGVNAVSAGGVIKVVASGDTVTAYINDVLQCSGTETFNQTATKHGIGITSAGLGTRFDNFSVAPL